MRNIILLFIAMYLPADALAQVDGNNKAIDVKYRRSSLHTILLESEKFPFKDTVIEAYYKAPFPDKYNDQTIDEKSLDPSLYGDIRLKDVDYPTVLNNYFTQNKVASKLVAKWFNRQPNGAFDMSLIADRGFYNASEMESSIAQKSVRGTAALADAGEELIGNTFVVVSKLNFVSNEAAAKVVQIGAYVAADQLSNYFLTIAAKKAADIIYNKMKEGYSVWCTSYLFRLAWNEEIANTFYSDYWMDGKAVDPARRSKFNHSDLFKLEYVGSEKSTILITYSLTEKRSAEKYVSEATVRSVDAVYAKLQKKYDIFKTKTPLYTGYPITAKIGTKEGLEGGERFEVMEQQIDEQGRTKYVRKGIITVDKNQIWNNKFSLAEVNTESQQPATLDRTYFKGSGEYYPGMLIRQIK